MMSVTHVPSNSCDSGNLRLFVSQPARPDPPLANKSSGLSVVTRVKKNARNTSPD